LPTRHNYGLGLPQYRIERTLAGWASELGTKTHLGCEVTGFTQDDSGVDVKLSDGATLRTQYLVGPILAAWTLLCTSTSYDSARVHWPSTRPAR
jgi:hypothetical protein